MLIAGLVSWRVGEGEVRLGGLGLIDWIFEDFCGI